MVIVVSNEASDNLAVAADDLRLVRGGRAILDGVSCRIERGTCCALLGPNGCGKTTLARCLVGQMHPTAGTLHVLDQTIGQTNIFALRRRIGLVNPTTDTAGHHVPGAVVDANLTARDAVLTGLFGTVALYDTPSEAQRQRAAHLLDEVGLSESVDQRFELLSTGEQRRALLARALIRRPELLILDEPTAGLDVPGRERLLATLERILASPDAPAVLLITHHVEELSPRTAQVLLMQGGRITAAGPPRAVITPERLSETFGCRVYVRRVHGRWWLEVLPEAWVDLLK